MWEGECIMNDEFWKECCKDDEYVEYLNELIGFDMIDEDTPAYGITKMIIDGRVNELSSAQWNTFVKYVANEYYVDECARCASTIPWCEMIEALDNGGYCSYCVHMMEKDD